MYKYYMLTITGLGLLIIIVMPFSFAQEINIPYLQCDITLSKSKITSGEPINVLFSFKNISERDVGVSMYDYYDNWNEDASTHSETEELKIFLQDSDGNPVPRRNLLCRPKSQEFIFSEYIEPGKTITGAYPLHLRASTWLKSGNYVVNIKSFGFHHGYRTLEYNNVGTAVKVCRTKFDRFSGPSLPLEIEPYNEDVLVKVFNAIMQEALSFKIGRWRGEEYYDIAKPVWTILWAEGPAAVPYQIELIYDKEKGFRYWPPAIVNTWDNIVRYATPEQIEKVLEMARHPQCVKDSEVENYWSLYYTPGLAWAIHEWHKNGSEVVREMTREFSEKLPEEDPCPRAMELGQSPYGE